MIRTCIVIVRYNIKKWKNDYHMFFCLIYLFLISDMILRPARRLAEELGVSPSVSSFSLIWNSRFFLLLFFFGVMLFYSNAPFQDSMSTFVMIRCGKMRFMIAQVCYIIVVGMMIPIVFFLIQFGLFPSSGRNEWGKFWGTLAQTGVGIQAGCRIEFQYHILWDYGPEEALAITFLICVLLTIMTGLLLYFFSLFRMKPFGICLLSGFIILPEIVDWLDFTTFNWVSPYSWICLDTTMKSYNGSLPSLSYVFPILCFLNGCLILGIIVKTKTSKEVLLQ